MSCVAAIQMASGPNIQANLLEADRLIARAVDAGAELVVLPESFALMGGDEDEKVQVREQEGSGPMQDFLASQAARNGIWLVGGTIPLATEAPDRVRAACLVYDASGNQVGRYDKMHLFDVRLDESRETYNESETIERGTELEVIDTPCGRLGLAVCYDLRFPELFRGLVARGMEICAVPAAFTAITGKAHWEVLVRARAIENLCYVIAAAQGGYHLSGRETHGDSMVVDPWGVVLDRLPRGSGVVIGDLERHRVEGIRRRFPAISHIRFGFSVP
jgi:predicted amidohydrolase